MNYLSLVGASDSEHFTQIEINNLISGVNALAARILAPIKAPTEI